MKLFIITLMTLYSVSLNAAQYSVAMNSNPAAPLTLLVNIDEAAADSIVMRFSSTNHTFEYRREFKQKFPVIGLKAGREYKIKINLYSNGKLTECSEEYSFITPELPNNPALIPNIIVSQADTNKMEKGYTLFNPRRSAPINNSLDDTFNQAYGMLIAVDHCGDVVWYFNCNSRISDFNLLDNGNISYLQQDNTLVEIDWAGNVVNSWYAALRPQKKGADAIALAQQTIHHDVEILPNKNWLALGTNWVELDNYWTNDYSSDKSRQKVMGDIIYEFTPSGDIVWQWDVFDYLNPYVAGHETFHGYWQRRGYPGVKADWSHANAVMYDKKDDAILVNFRHLSLILKIDKKSKDIIWAFGHHTDILKDKSKFITLESGNFPWHQHSPEITPNGTLLFFNNDNYKAFLPNTPEKVQSSYSYANEYYIDEKTMTGKEIWSSRQKDDKYIVSVAMGDVDYLPQTGNILASYGALLNQEYLPQMKSWGDRPAAAWTMMREFTHDNPAKIVWELRLTKLNNTTNIGWNIFGAERFRVE